MSNLHLPSARASAITIPLDGHVDVTHFLTAE